MDENFNVYRMTKSQLAFFNVYNIGDEITIWEWYIEDAWNAMVGHQPYIAPSHISHAPIFDSITSVPHADEWEIVRKLLLNDELDDYLADPDPEPIREFWYCQAPTCRGRECDKGHVCWGCGNPEGKAF